MPTSGEGIVAARPNLVAEFPAHTILRLIRSRCRSLSTSRGCTSSTARPVRRSASAARRRVVALVRRRRSVRRAPVQGRTWPRSPSPRPTPSLATDRIYFVMTDRYANGDPSNDTGGVKGTANVTGYDPTSTAWWHGGDLKGLTGGVHRSEARARAHQGSRLQRDLDHARRRQPGLAGNQRRLPRLLGHRLHARRSASRHRSGLRRLHLVRPQARDEGDPRRRRQPHRRHHSGRRRRTTRRRIATATARSSTPRSTSGRRRSRA